MYREFYVRLNGVVVGVVKHHLKAGYGDLILYLNLDFLGYQWQIAVLVDQVSCFGAHRAQHYKNCDETDDVSLFHNSLPRINYPACSIPQNNNK